MEHKKVADPSPALTRGLTLLKKLSRDGSTSLEKLARETGWPKSSVLRLLTSLQLFGAVERDPLDRRYRARMRLSLHSVEAGLRVRARKVMEQLCQATGHTVELLSYEAGDLCMEDRCEPEDQEVFVRARIGWQPNPNEAFGLPLALYAFFPDANWPTGKVWHWERGIKKTLLKKTLQAWVKEASRAGYAVCKNPNPAGVRRYVFPLYAKDDHPWGVLSIAATFSSESAQGRKRVLEQLRISQDRLRKFQD